MPSKKPAPDENPADVIDDRGQISISLGGQSYVMRPSWEAIVSIERLLRPLYSLANDASSGALTLEEMAVIAAEFMHAYGKANPGDALATDYKGAEAINMVPLIYAEGGPKVCARLMLLLVGALNGGYTAEGEAKAMGTTA